MANTNAPFGFRQYRGTGSAPTYEQTVRKIASGNTTKIFFGDATIILDTGYIGQAPDATTVPLAGVFQGCKYLSTSQKRTVWSNYWPGADATGDVEAYLITDPNAQFLVQAGATAIGFTSLGLNVALAGGTSGNTSTGISAMYVESPAVTAALPFRLIGFLEAPPGAEGTDIATAYNQVIVGFNNMISRNNGAGPTGL